MASLLFYLLGAVALLGALGVVLSKSAMGSVISLLGTFFALAVIYLLAGFQFLAAAQVLVYAGAILVLFLFVIMLLDLGALAHRFEISLVPLLRRGSRLAAAVAVGFALVGLIVAQRASLGAPAAPPPRRGIDDLEAVAIELFGRYSLAFQATSVLLLVTMVAVIVLAKRLRPGEPEED
jgi:NADH-quinone oxidoreductase subunit J